MVSLKALACGFVQRGAIVFGVTLVVLGVEQQSANASTFPVSYDVSGLSGDPSNPTVLDTYTGLSPATVLNFKLDIAPPGQPSFSEVVINLSLSDGTVLSSLDLLGNANGDGPTDYGLQNGVVTKDLFNETLWSVLLSPNPGGLNVLLTANAFVPDGPFTDFKPTLAVDIEGSSNVVPLPAAFPLFATGLGALGLLAGRRKRKAAAVA